MCSHIPVKPRPASPLVNSPEITSVPQEAVDLLRGMECDLVDEEDEDIDEDEEE